MTPLTRLDTQWLTEAVRLREAHTGPLDDQEANRVARQRGGDLANRVQTRALWLAERDGLVHALQRWKQGARLAAWALGLLAVLSGAGLGLAALGDGQRPVNVFWALGSLLGLDLLLLLGWCLTFVFAGQQGTALGRAWLWLSARFARDARAAHLAPALLVLLQRHGLVRWLLGVVVHGLWCLTLLVALGMLVALMATRRYGFVWETTLLAPEPFIALTQGLGALPSLLGFAVPDDAMIRASGSVQPALDLARQAWASWLLGVVLVYGWLPRALLAGLCLLRWVQGRAQLSRCSAEPVDATLHAALMPSSERLGVSDVAPATLPSIDSSQSATASSGALLVGLELDDRPDWPPSLPPGAYDAGVLDDRASRRRLLEQLERFPPARLLIACDPRRSPDRGSLGLIAELARAAGSTRIWLLPAPAGQTLDATRLGDWQDGLARSGLRTIDETPLEWLERGDA